MVAASSMRRSPTNHSRHMPPRAMNGSYQPLQHAARRAHCLRWLRWVVPILLASMLSSYATYLILYEGPRHVGLHQLPATPGLLAAVEQEHHAQQRQQVLDLATLKLQRSSAAAAAAAAAGGGAAAAEPGAEPGAGITIKGGEAGLAGAGVAAGTEQKGTAQSTLAAASLGAAAAATTTAAAAGKGGTAAGSSSKAQQQAVPKGSSSSSTAGSQPSKQPGQPSDAAQQWVKVHGRRMTVAIVNDAPYHLEIVAGFLHICNQLPVDVTWYQAGQYTPDSSFTPAQLVEMQGFSQLLGFQPRMRPATDAPEPVDFAIFISPEYFEKETEAFLKAAKPITAVILAHNGMNRAIQRIKAFHPRLYFAALAPHVAAAARTVLQINTHWMMATFPYKPQKPCSMDSPDAATCLQGFSIQGNFESARRNYTALWLQMSHAHAAGTIPTSPPVRPYHLHLVGRGNVKTLGIPPALANMTTVDFNLRFPEYYDTLHHTHALLMLLGSRNYLLQKMSSTVVSSLMTGVPIIADAKVLASYTFLHRETVFLMAPGETEMDVMQRILRMNPEQVYGVRQRVVELAEHLNRRTVQLLQGFMPQPDDSNNQQH